MLQPLKIFRSKKGELGFIWNNGIKSVFTPYTLRIHCPCAMCVDEHTGKKVLDNASVSTDIKIEKVMSIGRYAVGIAFDDGHRSGIYPYSELIELTEKD